MNTYIALLRGINVSGQKLIKMAELKVSLERAGLKRVSTYIQSGNVILASNAVVDVATIVEKCIKADFGFDVCTISLAKEQMIRVKENCPFLLDSSRVYFTFLKSKPTNERLSMVEKMKFPDEEFSIIDQVIYFYSTNGYGKAKMNNNFFENKLKVEATTRNWNTVCKLIEMAQENNS